MRGSMWEYVDVQEHLGVFRMFRLSLPALDFHLPLPPPVPNLPLQAQLWRSKKNAAHEIKVGTDVRFQVVK